MTSLAAGCGCSIRFSLCRDAPPLPLGRARAAGPQGLACGGVASLASKLETVLIWGTFRTDPLLGAGHPDHPAVDRGQRSVLRR